MKILVVGGGTAGWLTALTMRTYFPHLNVELIESEEIGILGAGESTTGNFRSILEKLGIDIREFLKETESTIKSGIKFDDWNYPGDSYLSLFNPWFRSSDIIKENEVCDYLLYCYVNDINVRDIGLNEILLNGKSPFIQINESQIDEVVGGTLHINAKLAAKYLRKIAESRGIIRHEGKIVKINGHYPIKSLQDDKGRTHNVDFVFDCSGFARLIIGKHYNTEWNDYTKHLTVNSTIPFFLPLEEKIPAYTHAIAMKYGWMFKVPTQKRFGSGYIYNSDLISKEQAIAEVQEKLGREVELINHFNFRSGSYKNNLVGNCIAMGLSSGFLEPMAATNLAVVCSMLSFIATIKPFDALIHDRKTIHQYNMIYNNYIQSSNMTEIFSHYVNHRQDTEFWQHYKNIDNHPPVFRNAYEHCFIGDKFDFNEFSQMTGFSVHTMITKLIGNDWFKGKAIQYYQRYNLEKKYSTKHNQLKKFIKITMPYIIDHRKYLENL